MANENLICPICGQPTRVYMGNARKDRLCGKHADELKAGNIVLGEDGLFYDTKSKKVLNKGAEKKEAPSAVTKETAPSSDLTCIACGKPSNGKHFCVGCYHKYNNKIIYIKVKNCTEFESLGSEYESDLNCEDGHIVKSEPERNIDNWLFNHDIKHIYEKELRLNEKDKIHPDWCLPKYIRDEDGELIDVYVEYWGIEGSEKYEKIKNYKLPLYEREGLTLVNINAETDKRDISAALEWKLNKKNIKPHKTNFLK